MYLNISWAGYNEFGMIFPMEHDSMIGYILA